MDITRNKFKNEAVVKIEGVGEVGFKFGTAQQLKFIELEGLLDTADDLQKLEQRLKESRPKTLVNFYLSAAISYCKFHNLPTPDHDQICNVIDVLGNNDEITKTAFLNADDPNQAAPQMSEGQ